MSFKRPFDPMIMTDYDVDLKCTFKGSEIVSILPNYKKHCDIRVSNVLVAVDQINVPTDESWPQHSHETRCRAQTDEYNEMGDGVGVELPNALNNYRYLTCCGKMRNPVDLSRLPDEFKIFLSLETSTDPCKPTNENLLPQPRHRSELPLSRVRVDYIDTMKRLGARYRMMFPEARIKSNDHIC
ncbi:hypothetical protein ACOME3_007398 [Neoechinorhynchus agilis]